MFANEDQTRIRNFVRSLREPCIAIFEVGTRAVRLLIAPKRVPLTWERRTFCNDSMIINLGLGVDFASSTLALNSPMLTTAIQFISTRSEFLAKLNVIDQSVIGTAWIRWLENADQIVGEIASRTGHRMCILSQEEEARMCMRAVPTVLHRTSTVGQLSDDHRIFLVDQGGGSLEITWLNWENAADRDSPIGKPSLNDWEPLLSAKTFSTMMRMASKPIH